MNNYLSNPIFILIGRILLALIFVMSGFGKIFAYAGTQQYMEAFGIPGMLLPLVILAEVGLGLAIIIGFQTRLAAFLLAGFAVTSGFIFHFDPADQMQTIMLTKNLAIAGGFFALMVAGAGPLSVDSRRATE